MHGLVLSELKRFTEERFGEQMWGLVQQRAGLGDRVYVTSETYPDSEFAALAGALASRSGADVQALLEQFGEFIAPTLMHVYKPYIKPEWKTLDTLEHTENNIHRAVRLHDPLAAPPRLKVRRVNPNEVVIIYESDRKLCSMAKGIASGIAEYFGERIMINELTCMLKGRTNCTITFTKTAP